MAAIDELIGNADAFPILNRWIFLNHAGVSPLPRVAAAAVRRYAREASESAYLDANWWKQIEQFRTRAAELIHAAPGEVAFIKNTSEGLSLVARGLSWSPGDRIVSTSVEYPANVYPWMDVAAREGVTLVQVPEEADDRGVLRVPVEKLLEEVARPRTRLLTLSHVEFASGQRHDLTRIGRHCREHGVLLNVDAIQSLGALPVDVETMNIDFLSADGHKWMLGPDGAGIFYCRSDRLQLLRPLTLGAMSVRNSQAFSTYDFTLREGSAGLVESGDVSVPCFLGLAESVGLLLDVGIDAVSQRIRHLTDRVIDGLSSRGYRVASPRCEGEWSGIVSFWRDGQDPEPVSAMLRKTHKIETAVRGGRLRVSPHFYNSDRQIDALMSALPDR